jgi:DNA-directed RNA polymerase subunit RPC12/RpoP
VLCCSPGIKGGGFKVSKKKYTVRAECPACACGDVSFLGPENLREKFIGNEEEVNILCPHCGTKIKGKVETEDE